MSKIGINEVLELINGLTEALEDSMESKDLLFNLVDRNINDIAVLEHQVDELLSERKPTIEDKVCQKIQERAEMGLNKYGTTMERTDLSIEDWLTHAQEESLDLSIYLEKIKSLLPIVK